MSYLFGVDYYPEHWPRERWPIDAKMMREMGLTVVRMAEFSWSKWEPREGEFHFEELDEVIEIMAKEGIDTILGTPSAAPPAWIIRRNPEIQPIDSYGLTHAFGGRHHDCQSNPVYRAHIRRFVGAFAEHFASNPHVVGWQVDNELGNSHGDLCFCPECEKRFRAWLMEKYGTIEKLNERWGTVFWSQGYTCFDEIQAPKLSASGHNPSQALDWKRFCSDLVLDFHKLQADILRKAAPDKFITHNMMGFSSKVDYRRLGEQLDFASHDQYPGGHFHARHDEFRADYHAAELDFIRSVKQRPFWIMEQQAGITGWDILGRAPKPGQLGLWATQCIAHGADTIVFFRWRSCLVGTEQYWHGILPHNGEPGRYYRELKAFIAKRCALLARLQGSMPENEVGILFSYDQEYALAIQPHHPQYRYIQHLMTYYSALYHKNVPVSFASQDDDLTKYKVLIAPTQFLMTDALAQKLRDYVQQGGTLVLDYRCGVKDDSDRAFDSGALPHAINDLCGVTVTEYDCLRDATGRVRWGDETYPCELWSDILEMTTAKPLAVYDKEFYADTPAVTVNRYEGGTVYYVGTEMSKELAERFVKELCQSCGLRPLPETPFGVEAASRVKDGQEYLFVMNHLEQEQPLCVPDPWRPLDEGGGNADTIQPFETRVFIR